MNTDIRKYISILTEDANLNITGNMVQPFQDWLNANVETHREHYRSWKLKQEDDGDKIGPYAFTGPEMITKYFSENTDRYQEFMNWYGKNKNKFINKYKANLKFLPDRSKKDTNNQNYLLLNYFTGSNEEIKKAYDAWYNKNYNNTYLVPSNAEVIHNFLKQNPEFVDQYVNITQKVNSLSPVMKKWINNNLGNSEVKAFLAWLTNVDPSSITESIIFENNEAHKEDPVYKAFLASQGGTNSDNKPIEVTRLQQQQILKDILRNSKIKNAYNKFLAQPSTTTESRFFSKRKLNEQIFTPQFSNFARTLVKTSPALAQQLQQAAVRAVQNVFGAEADAATLVNQEFQGLEDPFGTPNQSTVDIATGNNTNFAATANNKDGTPNDFGAEPQRNQPPANQSGPDPEDDISSGDDRDFAPRATQPLDDFDDEREGVDLKTPYSNITVSPDGSLKKPIPGRREFDPEGNVVPNQAPARDQSGIRNQFDGGTNTTPARDQSGIRNQFDGGTNTTSTTTTAPATQSAATTTPQQQQPPVPKPRPAAQPKYYPGVTEPDYNKSLRIAQRTLQQAQRKLSQGNLSNLDKMQAQTSVQRQNQLIKMYQDHLLANPRTERGKLKHHENMLNRSAVAAGQAGDQKTRAYYKKLAAQVSQQLKTVKESKLIDLQSYINKL